MTDNPTGGKVLFHFYRESFYLVPEGYDEFNIIKEDTNYRTVHLKSGYLFRQLQLIMSHACNFRCSYCYERDLSTKTGFSKAVAHTNMSFDIARKSIAESISIIKENDHSNLHIEFFGGEPLLNWNTIKEVLSYFENGEAFGIIINYSITTNGSLINQEIAALFRKYDVTITISFDSLDNEQRVYANGKPSNADVIENIRQLRNAGNYVTINATLSKETLDSFDGVSLIDFAIDNNIQMIGLILDLDIEAYNLPAYKKVIIDKIIDSYIYAQKKQFPVVGYWYQIFSQITGEQDIAMLSGYKTCPATGCKLSIEPDGRIFVCKGPGNCLGNLENMRQALASVHYLNYTNSLYKENDTCRGCDIEGFCSGVCMGSLEKKYGTINMVEKSTCDVYKSLIRKLLMTYERNN